MISKAFWAYAAAAVWGICTSTSEAAVVTFEGLLGSSESAYVGEDGAGGFSLGGASFSNSYTADWDTWEGFSYSNQTDTTTADYTNDTSAFPGGGANGSLSYGVGFIGYSTLPTVTYASAIDMTGQSVAVTNTTYAYLSMANGDLFAKQFGGATGDDPDFFLLTITGYLEGAAVSSVEFYLADFRFEDNSLDYIISDWTDVDLTDLGTVDELQFSLSSSDVGDFGMNTPGYFAIDNLATVPEPSALLLGLTSLGLVLRRRR